MFEQDYIMRLIKEMVRTILKLTFNIEEESPPAELLENKEDKRLLEELLSMVDAGDIVGAEKRLHSLTDSDSSLMVELLFYSYLNDKEDMFLDANGFDREQIRSKLSQTMDRYGLSGIAGLFV